MTGIKYNGRRRGFIRFDGWLIDPIAGSSDFISLSVSVVAKRDKIAIYWNTRSLTVSSDAGANITAHNETKMIWKMF